MSGSLGHRAASPWRLVAAFILVLTTILQTSRAGAEERPRIAIIATGGTIANTAEGRIPIETVLEDIRRDFPKSRSLLDSVEFEVTDILRVASHQFGSEDFLKIAKAAEAALADSEVDAVIVTQGSYVAEETAYLLNLLVRSAKPLIVVCAQRPHHSISNDGDQNLLDAIRVALSPEAAGKGALLVTNQTINSGREVVKTSSRPDAFSSGIYGVLGLVEQDGSVSFYRQPTRRHTQETEFDLQTIDTMPKVDVVSSYYDADPALIQALHEQGVKGIVVEGYTMTGDPNPGQEAALKALIAEGIPVVLTARGGTSNRIPANAENQYIEGDNLVWYKARILLQLALTKTNDPAEIQRIFLEY